MKIIQIKGSDHVYTSNVFLILGDWKRIEDINTLVDVGSDPGIVHTIDQLNTGIGKNSVEQVIITHNHSDHTSILPLIRKTFNPKIYAFSQFLEGVDQVLKNGDKLRVGDRTCEIIHTPGHSSDSISLYIEEDEVLLVGDAPLVIRSVGGAYEDDFVQALKGLCQRKIRKIYFGHGDPVLQDAHTLLVESLRNVRKSVRLQAGHSHQIPEEGNI